MRVLLIEDSLTMRRMEKNVLSNHDVHDVIEAGNAEEAFKLLDDTIPPDLILLDWHLPDFDGLAVTRKLKSHEKTANVPIIMVTSESSKGKIMDAMDAGVSTYVLKPFDDGSLWEKIERVAKKRGLQV